MIGRTDKIVYDSYHEAATWTNGDVCRFVLKIRERNLELVATWARVVVDLECLVVGHIFDLDLVIDSNFLVVGHHEGLTGYDGMSFLMKKKKEAEWSLELNVEAWILTADC